MREIRLLALLAACAAIAGCRPDVAPASNAHSRKRVAVIFDLGGRGDHGFNDGAAAGADRVAAGGRVLLRYAEGGQGAQRLETLRTLARDGNDLVISIGFLSSHDATIAAREFPATHFAVVDYSLPVDAQGRSMDPPANLAGLNFREEDGSYVVGALAGLTTRTRKVGFIGGMHGALITKFEAGYEAGVHRVCPKCEVLIDYASSTPAGFRDAPGGHRLAMAQYANGADVVYHAAGETGLGVLAAARDAHRLAIGVDVDQAAAAPGYVLTSMLKRMDVAVETVMTEELAGEFRGGISTFGIAENGIGYVYDQGNAPLIAPDVHLKLETLRAALAAGMLQAPSTK